MEIESGKKEKEYKVLKEPETIAKELYEFICFHANKQHHFLKKRHTLKVGKVSGREDAWEVLFTPVNHYSIYVIAKIIYSKNYGWAVYRPTSRYSLTEHLANKYYDIIYNYFNDTDYLPNPYLNIKKKGVSLWK